MAADFRQWVQEAVSAPRHLSRDRLTVVNVLEGIIVGAVRKV